LLSLPSDEYVMVQFLNFYHGKHRSMYTHKQLTLHKLFKEGERPSELLKINDVSITLAWSNFSAVSNKQIAEGRVSMYDHIATQVRTSGSIIIYPTKKRAQHNT